MNDGHTEQTNSEYSETLNYSKMTEAQREAEFRRQHQQYIAEKLARKKQILKLRKAQSSSDQSDEDIPMGSDSSKSSPSQKQVQNNKQLNDNKPLKVNINKENTRNLQKISVHSLNKKSGQWIKDVFSLNNNTISILSSIFQIKTFTKVKIISQLTCGYPYRIKINYDNSEILFSPSLGHNEEINSLQINYYIFARIIEEKLASKGIKLRQNREDKVPGVPQSMINNSFIHGRLNKKSQVLGKWEERFIVINREGIYSYKKFNEKHTIHIAMGSIRQMWTRFDIHDDMLVIKTMHTSKKTEFGIPLCQLACKNCWLYQFFAVMSKK